MDRIEATIDGLSVTIKSSGKRRTLGLTVTRSGQVVLHAPSGADETILTEFLVEKAGWIRDKLRNKFDAARRTPAKIQLQDGDGFCILGRVHRIVPASSHSEILPAVYGRDFILPKGSYAVRRRLVIQWLSAKGQSYIPTIAAGYSASIGIPFRTASVSDLQNRWASAAPDGRMNFHWKAMQLPPQLIRYVVARELCKIVAPTSSAEYKSKLRLLILDGDALRDKFETESLEYLRL